jgi:nucleoside-diphosphate-sugar epimerase
MNGMLKDLGLCLVTGATGFVGQVLVAELLAHGCQVRVFSRSENTVTAACEQVTGDWVTDPEAYKKVLQDVETVFHLAGIAHAKAQADDYENNSAATLAFVRQAAVAGVKRFIYVSSTKAMSEPGTEIMYEDSGTWPDEPYGYWKRITEQRLLNEINIEHIAVLRPCLIYGAGVKGNLLSMMKAIDHYYFPPLPETGSVRSMVAVSDVVSALLMIATNEKANRQVFIASDEQSYTAHGISVLMRSALGKPASRWHIPVSILHFLGIVGDSISRLWKDFPVNSGTINRLTGPAMYSSAKLQALGWKPLHTLEQQLPLMIDDYRKTK